MRRTMAALLMACVLLAPGPGLQASDGPASRQDEVLLKSVGVSTDGAGLLAYFRQRGAAEVAPERIAALVERLGDSDPTVSHKASGELVAVGAPAVPLLRQAARDPDAAQRAAMARRCLKVLEVQPGALSSAATRLLALRQPAGAAEALLAFLPNAEDETVLEEVRQALASLAYTEGKPNPALLAALRDPLPLRRATAIDVLCQDGRAEPRAELRRLLRDEQPTVRLRAALALGAMRDAEAVGALIGLLADLPFEQARDAEDFLADLAGEQAPKVVVAAEPASRRACRDAWQTWWQSRDGAGLLEEVRKRTLTEERRVKGEELLRRLGDDEFKVRQKAEADIRGMGSPLLPMLRAAKRHPDLEVRQRIEAILRDLDHDPSVPLSPVTARLIALRKPAGSAEALLAFLPFAEDESIVAEVQRALNAVVRSGDKLDPAVVRGLSDPSEVRRAAAAEAVCLAGAGEHLEAVRKLLADPEPGVRLKAALALAGVGRREAIPVLIDLVGQLSDGQLAAAEEYLHRLAREKPPEGLTAGESREARLRRREAWASWWLTNGERVALVERYTPHAVERYHGLTLLIHAGNNQVEEVGGDGKVRWTLGGLLGPQDAEVVGRDRVLVAEFNGQRVTERNLQGTVLWQKQVPGAWPVGVQRLRNGHTFIICRNRLLEVDRSGREVLSIARPNNDVCMARKMRDGRIVCVSTTRTCQVLDSTGKEIKSFGLQMVMQNGVDVLPNGHILVCVPWMNKVTEYDTEGKVAWEANATQPGSACRAANGNTVFVQQQWPPRVIEVDRNGQQVNELSATLHVYRVRRR
jgi:HEAT repeat protein